MDELALLRWQFTLPARLAQHHLPALTDEACFWAPAPGSWTVCCSEDGKWRPDWVDAEPDPSPPVTIAWLSWHLIWWLSDLAAGRRSRKLPPDIQATALRKLRMLNQARVLGDLRVPPANRLEALAGDRKGQHSIRINDQWRICFVWEKGGPTNVEIVD